MGIGMPKGKSLAQRVMENVAGSQEEFVNHQIEIQGYRDRLIRLAKKWRWGKCDDPDDPPFNLNDWLDLSTYNNVQMYHDIYHQYDEDLKLIAAGLATLATYAEAAKLYASLAAFVASFTVGDILLLEQRP